MHSMQRQPGYNANCDPSYEMLAETIALSMPQQYDPRYVMLAQTIALLVPQC
jgi:hypothetical protein